MLSKISSELLSYYQNKFIETNMRKLNHFYNTSGCCTDSGTPSCER